MSLEAAVTLYAALHVLAYVVKVRNRTYPRRLSLVLVGLGLWSAYLLVA